MLDKTHEEQKDCFAFKEGRYKDGCKILKEKLCMVKDCPFNKNKDEYQEFEEKK